MPNGDIQEKSSDYNVIEETPEKLYENIDRVFENPDDENSTGDTETIEDTDGLLLEPAVAEEIIDSSVEVSEVVAMAGTLPIVLAVVNMPGNVIVGITGAYYTETAIKILERLNEIRYEACKNGYINPITGKILL